MTQRTEQVELTAERRSVSGKQVKQLRIQGQVPGVMYGHDFDPVPLQFKARNLRDTLSRVGGSQLISIKIKGEEQPEMALVREVQRDPIRRNLLHVDFYRVQMSERLTAEIPLEIIGESPVIVAREGILLQGISTIEVECLPGDLVDAIEVDLSDLTEVDQGVYVHDLAIPSGIDLLTNPDEMIVRVVPLEEEEIIEEIVEEEAIITPEAGEVEVITAAKEEEEELPSEEG
jgi:large subunit ribosomal protein L25